METNLIHSKFDDPDYQVMKCLWLEYFAKLEKEKKTSIVVTDTKIHGCGRFDLELNIICDIGIEFEIEIECILAWEGIQIYDDLLEDTNVFIRYYPVEMKIPRDVIKPFLLDVVTTMKDEFPDTNYSPYIDQLNDPKYKYVVQE